jgi:NAD(P)-dependent dehydrogenase (short-subunit alcohol dehydrogenase family)
MADLTGRTALVTGAGRGIGRAVAERLARSGAVVAVHYGHSRAAAEEVVGGIRAAGGAAFAVEADLAAEGCAEQLWSSFDQQVREHADRAGVDILVNNAGITPYESLMQTTPESFDRVVSVNARAPFFLVQQALHGRLRDGGRIINVSSATARIALTGILAYAMSKAAVDVFTRTLAKELGERGITVNAVACGYVDTDINASWLRSDPEARRLAASISALNRVAEPEDIADVIAFLASDDSRWVTGHVIDATGGSQL